MGSSWFEGAWHSTSYRLLVKRIVERNSSGTQVEMSLLA
jgi:hypothetical protein